MPYKSCSCGELAGVRSLKCKSCGNIFIVSVEKKKTTPKIKLRKYIDIVEWKELKRGDRIKLTGRNGTYYLRANGDKMYMTDKGIYTIYKHDHLGLVVYSVDMGYGYIYMGPEKQSDLLYNLWRSPHKIQQLNPEFDRARP